MKNPWDHPDLQPENSSSLPAPVLSTQTIVSLARDLWRLRKVIDLAKHQGTPMSEALSDIADRLWDDLEVARIGFVDPQGQIHDPGARYEVAFIEGEGDGSLYVAETLLPGIQVAGKLIAIPTVVLNRGGKS